MGKKLERVTLVEDDPDIRALTELALRVVGGFHLDACASGAEALERTPAFAPDLILLDVMMPGMNGPELFKKLRTIPRLKWTPVVFITAKAQHHEVENYKKLGAVDVIRKPFDAMSLTDELRTIWGRLQSSDQASDTQRQVRAVLERHCAHVADEVSQLRDCLQRLSNSAEDPRAIIARAMDVAYKIKGSSGSIGFHRVGSAAQSLQIYLRVLEGRNRAPAMHQVGQVRGLLESLQDAVDLMSPEDSVLYNSEFPGAAQKLSAG